MYAITQTGCRSIASPSDAVAGETVVDEVPAALLLAIRIGEARSLRSSQLRSCDWTQLADNTLSVSDRAAWATYRQALRALPEVEGFPDCPWPTPPTLSSNEGVTLPGTEQ